jgi:hypothetical protein
MQTSNHVVEAVLARVGPTPGLVALFQVGSMVYQRIDPFSDWDFVAVVDDGAEWPKAFRRGGRETFGAPDGRQVEVMYTTAGHLIRRMNEAATKGLAYASQFAKGRVLYERGSAASRVAEEARRILTKGPPTIDKHDLAWECFDVWNKLKDVEDYLDRPDTARWLSAAAFDSLLTLFFRLHRAWISRAKDRMDDVRAIDSAFHGCCVSYLRSRSPGGALIALNGMRRKLERDFGLRFDAYYTSPPEMADD